MSRYEDVRSTLNAPAMLNRGAARAPGVEVPPEDRLFSSNTIRRSTALYVRLLVDLLSRPRAERRASAVRAVVEEILEPLVKRGTADLVQEFSVPLSGRMMMQVAGFPEQDAPRWRRWIKDMVVSGFSFTNRNERGIGFERCYPEALAYLDHHLAERVAVAEKPDDVLTRVLEAGVDGRTLTSTQKRMILFSVVSAGTNTLVNFISNTLLSLARDRNLLETLRSDRRLLPVAVEESLRRDSPSMYITRLCAEATDVAGTGIEPGEKLLLSLASANRDAATFPQPDEFRLDRQDQPSHVAFGWGSHLCLGAWVARQVGVTTLDALLDRVESIELEPGTAPIPYLSPQGNGLDELRVRLIPRREKGQGDAREPDPVAGNIQLQPDAGAAMTTRLNKRLYTAEATVHGGRDGHGTSSDGVLDVDVRPPKEMGGPGGATNPEQLFALGYGACFQSAMGVVGRRMGVDTSGSSVTARVTLGTIEGSGYGLAVELEVEIPGVDRNQAEEVVRAAHEVCPYSNATRGNIEVDLKVEVILVTARRAAPVHPRGQEERGALPGVK